MTPIRIFVGAVLGAFVAATATLLLGRWVAYLAQGNADSFLLSLLGFISGAMGAFGGAASQTRGGW